MAVSIDEHEFYVVAADGEFVYPQKVHRANINLGERLRYGRIFSPPHDNTDVYEAF